MGHAHTDDMQGGEKDGKDDRNQIQPIRTIDFHASAHPSTKAISIQALEDALAEENRKQTDAQQNKSPAARELVRGRGRGLPYPFHRDCTKMSPEEKLATAKRPIVFVC